MNNIILRLNNITARVYDRFILKNSTWELKKNDNWLIIGPNGSGKSTFAGVLNGKTPLSRGSVDYISIEKKDIQTVSFENLRDLTLLEEKKEEARFFSSDDSKTTVYDILYEDCKESKVSEHLINIDNIKGNNFHTLSTGEKRKVLIIKALLSKPKLLILDEPFEGLDNSSAKMLGRIIDDIINSGIQVIIISHRLEFIPRSIKKVLPVKNLGIMPELKRDDLDGKFIELLFKKDIKIDLSFSGVDEGLKNLVSIRNLNITYDNRVIYKNFSWEMNNNENWKISGPNGSGKSTLLSLISADNLLAYANEIYLFGRRRGSGESIFDIKKRMGIVSPELQLKYLKKIPVINVVLSGFFDSIGLYRKPDSEQILKAEKMLSDAAIDKNKRFDHLSFGEQRIILILRAVIKNPELLILDEPCQGLDPFNRKTVLDLCDNIASKTSTRLLYVSHCDDEFLKCINRELILTEGTDYKIIGIGE